MDEYDILMVVKYKTRTMLDPKKFVFDCSEDSILTDQVCFTNTHSLETLTIERRNLDYIITYPYRAD
jgi:hypothetical protein